MRLYKVTVEVDMDAEDGGGTKTITRFAGTQADARAARQGLVDEHGVKKNEVDIDEVEVPTNKAGLLEFLNELAGSA